MAAIFRARVKAGIAYNIEIPHQPVGSHKFNRSGGVGYDETCYHRNFVAVKCQNQSKMEKVPDAWDQAEIAQQDHKKLMREKQTQMKKMQELNIQRTQIAKKAQIMNKTRKILDQEMNDIIVDDRLRRKANAGEFAGFFRQLYFDVGEKDLVKRFETQFQIGIFEIF